MVESREELEARAATLSKAVGQLVLDVQGWNRAHPEEPAIDPDPSGVLLSWLNGRRGHS